VAVSALVEARVKFMAEFDVARIFQFVFHVLDGMTLRAFIDFECPFAVMTGTAGEPFSIWAIVIPRCSLPRKVELDVTIAALLHGRVKFMAECDDPVSLTLNSTSLIG